MDKLILDKLTATDIGVIIIAVCYLFERALIVFQKLYNMRTEKKPVKPIMPEDCVKELGGIVATLKRIEGTQKGEYRILKEMEKFHNKTDAEGMKVWYIKPALYRDITTVKEQMAAMLILLQQIERKN